MQKEKFKKIGVDTQWITSPLVIARNLLFKGRTLLIESTLRSQEVRKRILPMTNPKKKQQQQCSVEHPPTHSLSLCRCLCFTWREQQVHICRWGSHNKNICKYRMGTEGMWGRDEEECKYLITTEAFETSTLNIWRDWIQGFYCVYAAH